MTIISLLVMTPRTVHKRQRKARVMLELCELIWTELGKCANQFSSNRWHASLAFTSADNGKVSKLSKEENFSLCERWSVKLADFSRCLITPISINNWTSRKDSFGDLKTFIRVRPHLTLLNIAKHDNYLLSWLFLIERKSLSVVATEELRCCFVLSVAFVVKWDCNHLKKFYECFNVVKTKAASTLGLKIFHTKI